MSQSSRLALVTGAGIRLGRAIALELARAGYDLVLHAFRSREALSEVADRVREYGSEAVLADGDLSSQVGTEGLRDQVVSLGRPLDVLVNNAAVFERVPFAEISREQFGRMLDLNLTAPFFLTQGLLHSLENAEAPVVINVCDIAGERPISHYAHYSVSKAGLIMLTRALAVELGPKIRVNGVLPGSVVFPDDFDQDLRSRILARIPLSREGRPEDVAEAVRYLVEASYVTGHLLAVDGGRGSRL